MTICSYAIIMKRKKDMKDTLLHVPTPSVQCFPSHIHCDTLKSEYTAAPLF